MLVSAETVHDYQLQVGDQVVLRVQPDQDGDPISVTFHYLGVVNEFPTAPRDSFIVANADYITTMTGHNGTDTYLLDTKGASPASVASTVRAMTGTAAVVSDITTSRNVVGSTLTAVDLSGLTRIELAFALLLIVGATGLALGARTDRAAVVIRHCHRPRCDATSGGRVPLGRVIVRHDRRESQSDCSSHGR